MSDLNKVEATAISIDPATLSMKAGESNQLSVIFTPENTTDKAVTWSTSDASIATVDADGKVTAVAVGKATIMATSANGLKAECAVTVVETPATGIVIDKEAMGITGDDLQMRVGDVKTINVTLEPETATDKSVSFESSNPQIASVDAKGNVTALALGTTVVTIKTASGVSTSINVTVVATPAASISLNKTEATMKATETLDLVATLLPETTTDKSVTWTTSDETIATVDENGKVTAVKVGKATIAATTANGLKAECAVTVVETPVSEIVIDKEALGIMGDDLQMRVGDVKTINVTVEPETATDKSVSFESSNPQIASVDAKGNVTALTLGTTVVTIKATSGVSTSVNVTVVATPAASIKLNHTEATMKATETLNLVATILPETTTDKSITWSTSDEAIATVDADGKVTAVAVGKATITVTSANGLKAECAVTVVETPATGIVIDKEALGITGDNLQMRVGDVKTINVTVEPETATDKSVSFESSNPQIASVDAKGNVTALALGTTVVTIKATSGVSTTIKVTVVETPVSEIVIDKEAMGITGDDLQMRVGDTKAIKVKIAPETATNKTLTYESATPSVATVDENGNVSAVSLGTTVITIKAASGVSTTIKVTVIETPVSEILIDKEAMGITGDDLQMRVGDTNAIKVKIEPETATNKTVTYESSSPQIATVNENGNVTAVSLGTTVITIKASSGVSTTIKVTVVATQAASLTLNRTEATMKATETLDLIATILPETTTDKTVIWTTSDATIATVDENGKVTAVKVGKATIAATTANGLKAECAVTVVETQVGEIIIDKDAIGITGDDLQMHVGDTKAIKVKIEPATATNKTLTYESATPSVATVDENGNVTAVSLGTTVITIKAASGVSTTINVTVVATPAASLTLNRTEATMKATETLDLIATILPETTTDKTVIWTTSDATIATVDENGKVTAVKVGKATISAATANGLKAECAVTVVETQVGEIIIDKDAIGITGDDLQMHVGDTKAIKVKIEPATATNKTLTYESATPSVATVDENGNVTAVSLGTTVITIKAISGVSTTIKVTVIETPVSEIVIDKDAMGITGDDLQMRVGDTKAIKVKIEPETATNKTLSFESSNPQIATVDENGNVTAVSLGTTVITIKATSGVSTTIKVTVVETPVSDIIIDKDAMGLTGDDLQMHVGDTKTIPVKVEPATATNKTLTWSSSNPAIATVDQNGKVTALAIGSTVITIKAVSGASTTLKVTVVATPAASITLNPAEATVKVAETISLTATILPATTTDKTVTWTASDPAIATVDAFGVVTGVAAGKVTVTASTANGLKATCLVTVEGWPQPAGELVATVSADKVREGNDIHLSATGISGGYNDTWDYIWTLDGVEVSTDEALSLEMTMPAGTRPETVNRIIGLKAVNHGPDGEVLYEAVAATRTVTVYRRPVTPAQLLKKGNGTSHTLVVMAGIPDSDIASLGYRFVYGYTDNGTDHLAATTEQRYTRLDAGIYNNSAIDKWCYAEWTYPDGSIVTSGRRYLDGRLDDSFDASHFGSADTGRGKGSDDNTTAGATITLSDDTDSQVTVYRIDGSIVMTTTVKAHTATGFRLDRDTLGSGMYIVTVTTPAEKTTKKIIIK